uniref:Methanethiol oxidase n=1 Tax=Panagrolaimus sp. PS1159 TaxID=55785 RepID=A0AC35EQX1_9BILA
MSCKKGNCGGPGYATPAEAIKGPREKVLFITAPSTQPDKSPDALVTIDVDPESKTYGKAICKLLMPNLGDEVHHMGWNVCSSCHGSSSGVQRTICKLLMPNLGDEVHHMGWNVCSSCHGSSGVQRSHLILPCLNSSRIYIIDTTDPSNLSITKIIEKDSLKEFNVTMPHTAHCLADGNIMVSTLGDANDNNKCDFLLIDNKTFEPIKTWTKENLTEEKNLFGYDFWYQPYHNIMLSTEWGTPKKIFQGFNPEDVAQGYYGNKINVFNWKEKTMQQSITLKGEEGWLPLEVRFKHNPEDRNAFIGTALGSALFHLYKDDDKSLEMKTRLAATVLPKKVKNWALPVMPGLITDIIISMDDNFIIFSNWLHGDIRMYDIRDPFDHNPEDRNAFIGTALGSALFHLYKDDDKSLKMKTRLAATVLPKKVKNWALPVMPGLITDIIISMDDNFIIFSNWLHGDIRMYDIRDPFDVKLVGQVFVGGSIHKETNVIVVEDQELKEQPDATYIKGSKIDGGPQMLQLSLDGKRLYVTTSLYRKWDEQFYPDLIENGAKLFLVNIDNDLKSKTENRLKLNKEFLFDFGKLFDNGIPYLAHEMRYPNGDCTSDIFLK